MTEGLPVEDHHLRYFNSHPHEEDDALVTVGIACAIHFNSHPHEEDDKVHYPTQFWYVISTHILTKRMTPNSS